MKPKILRIVNGLLKIATPILLLLILILYILQDLLSLIRFEEKDILWILIGTVLMQSLSFIISSDESKNRIDILSEVISTQFEIYSKSGLILDSKETFEKMLPLNKIRVYALNTHIVETFFARGHSYLKADECTVMMRYTESDSLEDLKIRIRNWVLMMEEGRFVTLKVVGYNNLPDNHFIMLDEKVMSTGLFNLNMKVPTNQIPDANYFTIYPTTAENKAMIHSYAEHFDNYINHYESIDDGKYLLYDSRKQEKT